jgi:hypothetical protein
VFAPDAPVSFAKWVKRRRRVWTVAAGFLIILGTTAAVLAADAVAGDGAQKSRQAFAASSAEVASLLKLALQWQIRRPRWDPAEPSR